jgi:hypothetical protein
MVTSISYEPKDQMIPVPNWPQSLKSIAFVTILIGFLFAGTLVHVDKIIFWLDSKDGLNETYPYLSK